MRAKNELLCIDCWRVFSSGSWDGAAKPQIGTKTPSSTKRKVQVRQLACFDALDDLHGVTVPVVIEQKGDSCLQEPDTREALDGTSEGISEAAPSSNERPSETQDAQEQGDPLNELRRLSGAGVKNSDSAFVRSLMHDQADAAAAGRAAKSCQAPAEGMGSGGDVLTVPLKRAGSALARDKSGRFIGKSTPAMETVSKAAGPGDLFRRGCIDPDDPLEQDLMISQAHLFDDAPMRNRADSLNQVPSPPHSFHAANEDVMLGFVTLSAIHLSFQETAHDSSLMRMHMHVHARTRRTQQNRRAAGRCCHQWIQCMPAAQHSCTIRMRAAPCQMQSAWQSSSSSARDWLPWNRACCKHHSSLCSDSV